MSEWPKLYFVNAEGARVKLAIPEDERAPSIAPGGACPLCKEENYTVAGKKRHIAPDNRSYESIVSCCKCGGVVGTLRLETSTIFGLHEDEAVLLHGRARVY